MSIGAEIVRPTIELDLDYICADWEKCLSIESVLLIPRNKWVGQGLSFGKLNAIISWFYW